MRFEWLLVALIGCAGSTASQQHELQEVRSEIAADEPRIDQVEQRSRALSSRWQDVARAYERAAIEFRLAEQEFEAARVGSVAAQHDGRSAESEYRTARKRWIWAGYLIQAAAAVDAARIDVAREVDASRSSYSCAQGMSTAAYRRVLIARGVDLAGMDIDHIVPHALGGADHPMNYEVIPLSLNRSLGATWNEEKCSLAGAERCAEAVSVSRECGAYSGTMPGL